MNLRSEGVKIARIRALRGPCRLGRYSHNGRSDKRCGSEIRGDVAVISLGGLAGYSPNLAAMSRKAAHYVDRITTFAN